MKRRISTVIFTVILLFMFTYQTNPALAVEPNLNCKSALLMEFSSGKILYEYNAHQKLAPASVTKIMTMLLVMEAIDSGKIKLTDKVVVSENAKRLGGSTMYLETGEVRTVEELLKGAAVESANDACVALAEYLCGTEEEFVKRMNERAKSLGMNDTHFVNCYGFYDPNHYTSAYDVAIMSRELLKHSKILDYTTIWMETISEGRKTPFTLVNRNKMIKAYKGCDGLKTGYTKEALYCISATAKRGNVRLISVIMGAPTSKERNAMASQLLDIGFAKYDSFDVVKKGEVVGEVRIPKAKPESVKIIAKDNLNVIVEKGNKPNIEKKIEIFKDLKLPINKGDTVGIVKAVEGEKVFGQVEAIVDTKVEKMKFIDTLNKVVKSFLNVK
ncbi:D-alanyl-D-alanine carboxypeptidase family protein [Thermobrachium celere]|uniref:D-alanyl-D-alanine carboxypeptidase family protein n=1 Tax=Thermobrachium celere TaxID=53422 RepID=UPI0019410D91|nr:D-alanyl-D-alanine carboxypeptidase family protein [Thermobrachium celere]GFR34289.1 D-alanyl-D-alanine carboxypeptidase [Thermobrachium celere]